VAQFPITAASKVPFNSLSLCPDSFVCICALQVSPACYPRGMVVKETR
jgi:hypothetical protein